MKNLLMTIAVFGYLHTCGYAASNDVAMAAINPAEVHKMTSELREIRSKVIRLQHEVIRHQETSGLDKPPLFAVYRGS